MDGVQKKAEPSGVYNGLFGKDLSLLRIERSKKDQRGAHGYCNRAPGCTLLRPWRHPPAPLVRSQLNHRISLAVFYRVPWKRKVKW